MMRKILIPAYLSDDGKQTVLLKTYSDAVEAAGAIPLIFPFTLDLDTMKAAVELVDGLLLTGGGDVDPALYGEDNRSSRGIEPMRDQFEMKLMFEAKTQGKRVLGICRGIQLVNASLGGTLYQDLPTEYGKQINHSQPARRFQPVHSVQVQTGSLLHALLGHEELSVNSTHHQAVRQPAPELHPVAVSPDGVIEGLESSDNPILLVQWHPERLRRTDPRQDNLFRWLATGELPEQC